VNGGTKLKKYLFHNKTSLLGLILIKLLSTLGFVGFAFIMRRIVDYAANANKQYSFSMIIIQSAFFCVFVLITYALNQVSSQFYINKCVFLLRNDYLSDMLSQKYYTIQKRETAVYLSDLTNTCNIIKDRYFGNCISLIDDIESVILSFAFTAYISVKIAMIMFFLTLIMLLIPLVLKKPINEKTKCYSEQLKAYTSKIKEILSGLSTIKSFGAEKIFTDEAELRNCSVLKSGNILAVFSNISWIISFFISYGLQIMMMGVAAFYVIGNKMTVGSIVAVLSLSQGFYGNIQNTVSRIVGIISAKDINEEAYRIMSQKEIDKGSHIVLNENYNSDFKTIHIDNISFRYGVNSPLVLDNVSLQFDKGKKYLILGNNGSGKSTLLKIISNLYSPTKGEIRLNETAYQYLDAAIFNKTISYVQQNEFLFNKTLRDNIDILGINDEERLKRVVIETDLNGFISGLSDGLDTIINEEEKAVSGGEKARIALARAIYQDNPVILFDEVNSSLDKTTSRKIEQMILSMNKETVINVCHKFEIDLLSHYDQIIILENGKILEKGSFLEIKNSRYLRKYYEPYE
jgi:ABC-type multidrug transport system fused ATPase/permease subunit